MSCPRRFWRSRKTILRDAASPSIEILMYTNVSGIIMRKQETEMSFAEVFSFHSGVKKESQIVLLATTIIRSSRKLPTDFRTQRSKLYEILMIWKCINTWNEILLENFSEIIICECENWGWGKKLFKALFNKRVEKNYSYINLRTCGAYYTKQFFSCGTLTFIYWPEHFYFFCIHLSNWHFQY